MGARGRTTFNETWDAARVAAALEALGLDASYVKGSDSGLERVVTDFDKVPYVWVYPLNGSIHMHANYYASDVGWQPSLGMTPQEKAEAFWSERAKGDYERLLAGFERETGWSHARTGWEPLIGIA